MKAAEASARAIRGKASKTRSSGRGGLGEEGGDGAKDAGVMIDLALDDSVTSPGEKREVQVKAVSRRCLVASFVRPSIQLLLK